MMTMLVLPFCLLAVVLLDQAIAEVKSLALNSVEGRAIAASQDDQDRLRSFYVEPDSNGNITGQISAIEIESISAIEQELEVSLIKAGKEIRTARTQMGQFELVDVPDDETYTFIASGQEGFLAYAIRVTPRKLRLSKRAQRIRQQYVSAPANVPVLPRPSFTFNDEVQIDAAAIPPTFETLEQIVGSNLPSDADLDNSGIRAESAPTDKSLQIAANFTYALNPDGSFSGKVILPNGNDENRELSDLNIFLLQDDMQVPGGQTSVERNGQFSLGNSENRVKPGIYALVAAGRDGFAAVSVKLVEPSDGPLTQANREQDFYASTGLEMNDAEFYLPLITDPRDLKYIRNTIQQINRDREQQGIVEAAPLDSGFGQLIDDRGFIAGDSGFGGNFGGDGAVAGNNRIGSFGRLGSIDRRRLLRRLLLTGGIIAISVGDNSPTDESPSTLSQ